MTHVSIRLCLALWMCLLGLTLAGMAATTWTVPNGDSLTQIQSIINGAAVGDTISFATGGTYNLNGSLADTTTNNLTLLGNGCTLNLTATTGNSLFYLSAVSNVVISGFTFNGSDMGGNIWIDPGCSYLTITNNTMQNNTYSGSDGRLANAIFGSQDDNNVGLTHSAITFNTVQNMPGGFGMYSPGSTQITDNTFINIVGDQMNPIFDGIGAYISNDMVYARNVNQNCCSYAIEAGGWNGANYTVSNMLVDSNIFTNQYGGEGENNLSLVAPSTGTVVSNNILTLLPPLATGGCGFIEFVSDAGLPMNGHVTHNVMTTTQQNGPDSGIYTDGACNMSNLGDYNLFVNVTSPISEGTSPNDGGSPDVYQYNWCYGCTTSYPNNYNLNGACPTVSIAGAQNGANGIFTFTSSLAPSQNTPVTYTLSGTGVAGMDYQTLSGTATLAAGATSVSVPVTHLDSYHGVRSVIATLTFGPYYMNSAAKVAAVNVNTTSDGPTVTIAATATNINEAGGSGAYTITRTGGTISALTVNYTMGGTAVNGTDYLTLSGSAIIPSGASSVTVPLTTLDRALISGSRTAVMTLTPSDAFNVGAPATVTILDNDAATGKIDDANAAVSYVGFSAADDASDYAGTEHDSNTPNDSAQITFTSTQAFVIGKIGPNEGKGAVYLDGMPVGTFDAYAAVDAYQRTLFTLSGLTNGSHTLKIVVTGTKNASAANDDVSLDAFDFSVPTLPTLTVAATPSSINEAGGASTFTLTRSGSTVDGLTVPYTMSGTAVNGTDYQTLSGSLTIPSGATTGTVTLTALDRALTTGSVTATLTLTANAAYTLGAPGAATVTIADTDPALTGVTLSTPGFVSPMTLVNVPPGGITLHATPTGGKVVDYQFGYCLANAVTGAYENFVSISGYSTTATVKWYPTQPGAYLLVVRAREQGASVSYQVSGSVAFTLNATPTRVIVKGRL